MDALPTNARRYLERLSTLVGAPIVIVSVGPGREQTMRLGPAV
jgi:adenylosuccinate synthase